MGAIRIAQAVPGDRRVDREALAVSCPEDCLWLRVKDFGDMKKTFALESKASANSALLGKPAKPL